MLLPYWDWYFGVTGIFANKLIYILSVITHVVYAYFENFK